MPEDRAKLEIQVSFPKLLIGLLITIIPISIAGLYATTQSQRALENTIGAHFQAIAESTAGAISQFIHERVIQVAQFAATPELVSATAASNRTYAGMTDETAAARITKIDQSWDRQESEPFIKQMLSSPVSVALRRYLEMDPRIIRITVTDARGATIAATHKTMDYYQADEEYWQNIYAEGKGALSVTDVLYDERTKHYYIGVGVPVLEPGSDQFAGTVDALIDVSSLFPIVNRMSPGRTVRSILVKNDGTVISGPELNLAMAVKSQEYAAVRDALNRPEDHGDGYAVVDLGGGRRHLVGYADAGLQRDYRNLNWIVLVAQDANEAFGPIRAVSRMITLAAVVGLLMVTLLGAYFVMHRRREFTDIGEPGEPDASRTPSEATTKTHPPGSVASGGH